MIKLIYPKESYLLMGLFFEVYNQLGSIGYFEKHFQKAIENLLKKNKIRFESQRKIILKADNEIIGRFYIDLLVKINNKIIAIELKKVRYISRKDINQIYCYLKATGIKLGIIVNFGLKGGLRYKRVVNIE